jgi:hypothetical protein
MKTMDDGTSREATQAGDEDGVGIVAVGEQVDEAAGVDAGCELRQVVRGILNGEVGARRQKGIHDGGPLLG